MLTTARVTTLLLMATAAAAEVLNVTCDEERFDPSCLVMSPGPKAPLTSRSFLPRLNTNSPNRNGFLRSYSFTKYYSLVHLDQQETTPGTILTRRRRSVREDDERMLMTNSQHEVFPSYLTIRAVEEALRMAVRNNHVILLHDNQPGTKSILQGVLGSLGVPLILVDLGNQSVTKAAWLGDFNSALYVHLLVFADLVIVTDFLEIVPEHTWVPQHLLLFNTNWSLNAATILGHSSLRHTPFLTLLQPHREAGGTPTYRILTHESFKPGHKIIQTGILSSSSSPSFSSLFPDRFPTFHGHHFHLSSWVDDYPYIIPGENETLRDAYGIGINMLNDIASIYNFTYQVYEKPEDGMWGDLINGSWRGMIGEVKREERDLCINLLGITEDQLRVVDFSVPYTIIGFAFLLRNPLPPPRWWSIAFPLGWDTWVVLLMFVLMLPLFALLLIKVHGASEASVSTIYLEVLRTLLRQDSTSLSEATIRMFWGTWWVSAMVLSISYTGNLVAYITVPAKPQILTTLQQLAESDIIPTMLDYGTLAPIWLKTSEERTFRMLGEKLLLIPPEPYQYGFDLVETGRYAFLEGAAYFRYTAIKHRVTNAYFLQEVIFPLYNGWIFPKHTAWKHKFDICLQRFVESGLLAFWKKWLEKDMRKKMNLTENSVEIQQERRPLNVDDMKGIFFVYLAGVVLVVVAGALEVIQDAYNFLQKAKNNI